MITASAAFRTALRSSHTVVVQVEVLDAAGLVIGTVVPTAGSVKLDANSSYRRLLSLTVGSDLIPDAVGDLLSPYGNQLRVRTGIRYPDTNIETIPLGTYRIQSVSGDRTLGPVEVVGYSQIAKVDDDKFLNPRVSDPILTIAEQMELFIVESIPSAIVLNESTLDRGVPSGLVWESDRWGAIAGNAEDSLGLSIGAQVWLDELDQFIIRDTPKVTDTPVATVEAGEGGALISAPVELSRDGVYNAWVVTGATAGSGEPPVQAIEYDDNPVSATRWSGPFGHSVGTFNSTVSTTVPQCFAIASALLQSSLGLAKSVDLTAVPDPTLEPGDVINVVYPGGRSEKHLIDSVEIPLTAAGNFVVGTRAQTYEGV